MEAWVVDRHIVLSQYLFRKLFREKQSPPCALDLPPLIL